MGIWEILKKTAFEKSKTFPDDYFVIRGLWHFKLLYRPNVYERIFSYTVILAQSIGQGCCYTEETPVLDINFIGQDAREISSQYKSVEIAALDAVYDVFEKKPARRFILDGSSASKTVKRSEIVIREVLNELKKKKDIKDKKPKVINVGAVGNFIKALKDKGIEVYATDRDNSLIGQKMHDVTIESGEKTIELIKECDLALITGMTLSTGTLDDILDTSKKHKTKLVMFAETGANFAEEYCKHGIDVVISEPFPFYIFKGRSIIDVYRRKK
jgi:uncharacterized protein (DUF4213/DUF364 family)